MNKRMESKSTGVITTSDYKRLSVKISYWLMVLFLILCSLIALLPVIWAFLSGFKELNEYYSTNPSLFPDKIDWGKLLDVSSKLKLGRSFINSMILFFGCWFGEVIVGGIAGYTISRLKPKGSKLLFTLMLWTMMMPHTLTMVPMFMTWTDFPLIHINFQNTWIPLWTGSMANIFNILLFKNFFDSIPKSYIEAAKIDGCSNIGIFAKIIVPLSKPIISTVTVFVFNGTWNNFMGPFLYLKDPNMATVALRLYNTTQGFTEPEQMLAAFVVMIPSVIVFMICSKQIMGNNMNVGVKG